MLFALLCYFMLAIGIMALVCMPPLRSRAASGAHGLWSRGRQLSAGVHASSMQHVSRRRESVQGGTRRLLAAVRRRAAPLALALAVIVTLPVIAGLLRGTFRIDSFDPNAARAVDERVADLLDGENLVPPPPLPPDYFTTSEVEQWQPMARSASRQWDLLDESFRQRLLMSFKLLHDRYGYDMVLIEGYRSPQRQAMLATMGPSVTRAGPFESYHQFGLAADCAFLRDGRIVISEKDPWAMAGYERYGEVAKTLGLKWGGDWSGLRDLGHVELRRSKSAPLDGDNSHS